MIHPDDNFPHKKTVTERWWRRLCIVWAVGLHRGEHEKKTICIIRKCRSKMKFYVPFSTAFHHCHIVGVLGCWWSYFLSLWMAIFPPLLLPLDLLMMGGWACVFLSGRQFCLFIWSIYPREICPLQLHFLGEWLATNLHTKSIAFAPIIGREWPCCCCCCLAALQ